MDQYYFVTKNGKDIDFLSVNAVFSTIYAPIVPIKSSGKDIVCYEKGENKFMVTKEMEKTIISGQLSNSLLNKLTGYGLELNDEFEHRSHENTDDFHPSVKIFLNQEIKNA